MIFVELRVDDHVRVNKCDAAVLVSDVASVVVPDGQKSQEKGGPNVS